MTYIIQLIKVSQLSLNRQNNNNTKMYEYITKLISILFSTEIH